MTEEYYTWREFETTVAGERILWAGKPGLESWDALDPAARLLAEGMTVGPGQRVLDLRCGTGICGALAARRDALVTLCDDNLVAVEAAGRTLALNGVTGQVIHGDGAIQPCKGSEPSQGHFDLVLLNAPRGREWVRHLIGVAARALRPGGKLLLAGPNRGGIKGFIEDTREIVGPCEVMRIKAGHRLAVAEKSRQPHVARRTSPLGESRVCEATVRGQPIRFVTRPGVFSHGELDAGTRALIETMVIRPGEMALDLGCGCGIIGAVTAQAARQAILVDCSAAALKASRTTLELNSATAHTQVIASDCASAVRDMRFDVVVTNPPFHQGLGVEFDVAQQFVHDAAEALTEGGGRLILVANRFIRYERTMRNSFAKVLTLYEDHRFHVLEAVRR